MQHRRNPLSMHVVCLCSWVFLSGTLNYCFNFMVKLDLKGSIDHGFGQGAFLVAPLGGEFGFDPPTYPSTLHRVCLLLCIICLVWPNVCSSGASRGCGCTAGVHQALQVVCPPIEAGKHGRGLNG